MTNKFYSSKEVWTALGHLNHDVEFFMLAGVLSTMTLGLLFVFVTKSEQMTEGCEALE